MVFHDEDLCQCIHFDGKLELWFYLLFFFCLITYSISKCGMHIILHYCSIVECIGCCGGQNCIRVFQGHVWTRSFKSSFYVISVKLCNFKWQPLLVLYFIVSFTVRPKCFKTLTVVALPIKRVYGAQSVVSKTSIAVLPACFT